MKSDSAQFVSHCDSCQRINAEHQKPAGLLQPLPIPVWKWDEIGMDFVVGLAKTQKGYDFIWVNNCAPEGINPRKTRRSLLIQIGFFLFRTCAPENINLRKQLWS